jgi:hypothetical protein
MSWSRGKNNRIRHAGANLFERNGIIAFDPNVGTEHPKILHEIERE